MSLGLTCGTISGTSGSILKKLELSTTIEFLAAFGANFSEIFPPAEKKVKSTFEKSKFSSSSILISLPLKFKDDPKLLVEANKCKLSTLKFFFSKTSRIFLPTFPVAPTIAIFIVYFVNLY